MNNKQSSTTSHHTGWWVVIPRKLEWGLWYWYTIAMSRKTPSITYTCLKSKQSELFWWVKYLIILSLWLDMCANICREKVPIQSSQSLFDGTGGRLPLLGHPMKAPSGSESAAAPGHWQMIDFSTQCNLNDVENLLTWDARCKYAVSLSLMVNDHIPSKKCLQSMEVPKPSLIFVINNGIVSKLPFWGNLQWMQVFGTQHLHLNGNKSCSSLSRLFRSCFFTLISI